MASPEGYVGEIDAISSIEEGKSRLRTLSEKGKVYFNSQNQLHRSKLDRITTEIDKVSVQVQKGETNLAQLRLCERNLTTFYDRYQTLRSEYSSFLKRCGVTESDEQLQMYMGDEQLVNAKVKGISHEIKSKIQELVEKMSEHAQRSERTHKSKSGRRTHSQASTSLSVLLARKQAEAESSKVALQYAKKEAELLKKQAEMEAEKTLLVHEKKTAVIEAEVKVLQAVNDSLEESSDHDSLPVEDSRQRTQDYVNNLPDAVAPDVPSVPGVPEVLGVPGDSYVPGIPDIPSDPNINVTNIQRQNTYCRIPNNDNIHVKGTHDINFMSVNNANQPGLNVNSSPFQGTDIAYFLLKKDLTLSRLSKFNDQPESYPIWKSNFRSVVSEVKVSAVEEFDLLIKWLGSESVRHAVSIRAAYADNPDTGLLRLWERLDERFGCPEMVKASLETRLSNFPRLTNKDCAKLYDLADLAAEINSFKQNPKYAALLSYYDSSSGVIPVVQKLPFALQERWTSRAFRYKQDTGVPFPPFTEFVSFLREVSKLKNDPSFLYDSSCSKQQHVEAKRDKSSKLSNYSVHAKKTDVEQKFENTRNQPSKCPIHNSKHTLSDCKVFRAKPFEERKEFLKQKGFCYKCCTSRHLAMNCTESPRCGICDSTRHATAMHNENFDRHLGSTEAYSKVVVDNTSSNGLSRKTSATSKCTQICNGEFHGKSCAKIVMVKVYPSGQPQNAMKLYAVLDDQSNSSLAKSEFFAHMNITGPRVAYTLSSCSGVVKMSGRRASGFVIESLDGKCRLNLPSLTECNEIPDTREEIATPAVARHYLHLSDLVEKIPPVDSVKILLLIGRDMIEAHHVLDQRVGPGRSPYAQKLPLGWVLIGETCLGKVHVPDHVDEVTVMKTHFMSHGRPTILKPCQNDFHMKDFLHEDPLFSLTKDDDKIGLSQEDQQFLGLMDKEMHRGPEGNWVAPLPFKDPRPLLPNNKDQAVKRAKSLKRSMDKDPVKRQQMIDFMAKILSANHAERAPSSPEGAEVWYLPLFGVHHPKKPDQIRGVFDSSAAYQGISLNSVLMKGPDIANRLIGVILRFRKEAVAVLGDIEKMFHCFHVPEGHRDYLRFLWHDNNDPENELVEYRMRVHVFGNKSSPAIATYGLRKAAASCSSVFGQDVKEFVDTNFYVDDGIASLPSIGEGIDLVKRTQAALKTHGNIRFHKIASNSPEVMNAFPSDERASDLKDLNFMDHNEQCVPIQRTLGISWDIKTDTFVLHVSVGDRPYTKRGILSTVHSIYDPMGFLAPVTIRGRLILRDAVSGNVGWDDVLSNELQQEWSEWIRSLKKLTDLRVSRPFTSLSFKGAAERRILMYCDASERAIAAVCYLELLTLEGESRVGFIMGKTKVAPKHGHTIPRLELCAAVLSVQLADRVCDNLDIPQRAVVYHTDSKIILGYIRNVTKRFTVYISNRVSRILRSSSIDQWRYVRTELNPADEGTRSIPSSQMVHSTWINGPQLIRTENTEDETEFEEVFPTDFEQLAEIRVQTTCVRTQRGLLGVKRFERFSTWRSLVNGIAQLLHFVKSKIHKNHRKDISVSVYSEAENLIIKEIQHEVYQKEIECLRTGYKLPKTSALVSLDPFLDDEGLLRVGGRLHRTNFNICVKHPLVIPRKGHISQLLILHYHNAVKHQGRHLTEGAIRSAGYWIIGMKRLVSSIIYRCVTCRKLRGPTASQKMSDLPPERLEPSPPFTYVGIDLFGPWNIVARRTRGGLANSKRWAVLFTCLVCRAVHIEVVEDLSTDAFINALRRFVAIRGNVKQFRSDRGTNFIGATDILDVNVVNVEDRAIKGFLRDKRSEWVFNPPHSSHMGGVWERLIGVSRRILYSLLLEPSHYRLTHDMLVTLMAEVSAIVNNRPIVPVSTDPESPTILSPSALLTQKTDSVSGIGDLTPVYDLKHLYKTQWQQVQSLADAFWHRWKVEYLHTLQSRRKWRSLERNVQDGDVILLSDKNLHRNQWKLGVVVTPLPSDDGKTRQVIVRTMKDGKPVNYTRPITELTLLLPAEPQ